MRPTSFASAAVLALAACTTGESVPPVTPNAPQPSVSGETASFLPAGPQSYTPDVKPKGRSRAVRQLWASRVGATDSRSTLAFADGAIWVGTKRGAGGEAGVYVVEGKTGARRALLPGARGDVIGIALDAGHVYSSSAAEVAVTTKAGVVQFRTAIGAPIVTPPTLVDVDGVTSIVVGDAKGRVSAVDGRTGKVRWTHAVSPSGEPRASIGSGLAAADLDGDGVPEILCGTESGQLVALRGRTGEVAWQLWRSSALRAAPVVSDVDADGKPEVIAGWADGDVAIVDGKSGKELWSTHVEEDDGDPTGLSASPTPVPGGSLLVPTSRWGKSDSVVLLRAYDRAYRSRQGSVVASPVLATIQQGTTDVEAVVGTLLGDVVSFDAAGGMSLLYHFDGPIDASALIADIQGDGLQELVVATRDGRLEALAIHATQPPLVGRARGSSLRNDGVLPEIDLGWRLR